MDDVHSLFDAESPGAEVGLGGRVSPRDSLTVAFVSGPHGRFQSIGAQGQMDLLNAPKH